jgi:hypothetical protein
VTDNDCLHGVGNLREKGSRKEGKRKIAERGLRIAEWKTLARKPTFFCEVHRLFSYPKPILIVSRRYAIAPASVIPQSSISIPQ